jgi:serine/threonine protein kinase
MVSSTLSQHGTFVGQRLGKYLITARLGQGAEGMVFRGLHQTLNSDVAIKILKPNTSGENGDLEALRREASLLAKLNHPNIVRLFDFEDNPVLPYLVLEFVEGNTLWELIEQSGAIRWDRALNVILQIADGLAAAAELGILHRDIKPANIMVTKTGFAKLADLGTGILMTACQPKQESGEIKVVGTAMYMPPEQFTDPQKLDIRSDIYALGATLYHAITGQVPFEGSSMREVLLKKLNLEANPDLWIPPHEIVPNIPEELSHCLRSMMAANQGDRPNDYRELILELREIADSNTSEKNTGYGIHSSPASRSTSKGVHTIAPNPTLRQTRSVTAPPTSTKPRVTVPPTPTTPEEVQPAKSDGATDTRKCPFCLGMNERKAPICVTCGARDSLASPTVWDTHRPLRPELIEMAIEQYQKLLTTKHDVRYHLAVALAHLNLGDFEAAARSLGIVHSERPGIRGLKEHLEWLTQRLGPKSDFHWSDLDR